MQTQKELPNTLGIVSLGLGDSLVSAYKNFTIMLESDRLVIDATPNAFERHSALMVTGLPVIVN
jgi:hypothetical protein